MLSQLPAQSLVVGSGGQATVQQLVAQMADLQEEFASLVGVDLQAVPSANL
jgi:hypothetical protein